MAVINPALAPSLSVPDVSLTASSTQEAIVEYIDEKAKELEVDALVARKIAFCESTMRQFDKDGQVVRGIHNPSDIGLFQINEKYHLTRSKGLGYDIYTTEGNVDYALYLLRKEGTRHWYWSKPCWSVV